MSEKPFTFVCGNDDYLVGERGRKWFAEQTQGLEDDLSKEVIEGQAESVAEVEDAVNRFLGAVRTLSLFGERKVVWFRGVTFLADSQTGRAKGTLDQLEGLKATLETIDPATVAVLITASPVDKRRSFFKWCKATAAFEDLSAGKDAAAVYHRLVKEECEKAGVRIERDAVELLIGKVNGNSRLIVEETRKLTIYLGEEGGSIDENLVNELVPNFGQGDFFEATDAFFSLRLDWALEALRRHFFTEKEARPLLASLQSRNRLMIQLRVLIDGGALRLQGGRLSTEELKRAAKSHGKYFGESAEKDNLNVFTQNGWYLGRLAEAAQKASLRRLVDFQIAFSEAFESLIERPNEQEEICRELAVRCLS
ncbi:MAG: DNA polymerase III subunit delta [Opitutales bacterium]